MCGFVGFVGKRKYNKKLIDDMSRQIISRGPDSFGSWTEPELGVFLGHRRLSILDLSKNGNQPMISLDGRYVMVFNGEIYNHLVLRKRLLERGFTHFKSNSDTETLLEYVSNFGLKEALNEINGMFAFCLYDRIRKKLFLAKDRLGEKPLYYGKLNNTFFFGSELKAFKPHPDFVPSLNEEVIHLFLKYSYIPTPYSIFKNVFKLPASTYLEFDIQNQSFSEPIKYWDFNNKKKSSCSLSEENITIDDLEIILNKSIKSRMISDVPIGAFLSGGIDSSLIALQMQKLSNSPINTFTIGFEELGYDESSFAKEIAKSIGTNHTNYFLSSKESLELLPQIPLIWDEPFADSSQIPTFFLSRIASNKVKVALSGDGGDELFCGYTRYTTGYDFFCKSNRLPIEIRKFASYFFDRLSNPKFENILLKLVNNDYFPAIGNRFNKIAEILKINSDMEYYQTLTSIFSKDESILVNKLDNEINILQDISIENLIDFRDVMMNFDIRTYLQDDILVKLDRASMSNSLETRVPFLDHDLVKWAWDLPIKYKYNSGTSKYILRKLLFRSLPEDLFDRPKRGFGLPISNWLFDSKNDWARDLLSKDLLKKHGFFDSKEIDKLVEDHKNGKARNHHKIWNIICFQAWFDLWMN